MTSGPASAAAAPRATGRPAAGDRILHAAIDYFATHGTGEISMRGLAARLGTSHRMLNYYFGSREGLLTAVVEAVEAEQRSLLSQIPVTDGTDPRDQLTRFWNQVTASALIYAPLFFELSADAMRGLPHAEPLREVLITPWLEILERHLLAWGYDSAQAAAHARIGLAVARGLLFDLLVTGDQEGVAAAMQAFIATVVPPHSSGAPARHSGGP